MIHVRDLVRGLAAVAEAPAAAGQAYFLAHPECCSGQELMGLLGRALGRTVRAVRVPTLLCRGAGAIGELLGLFRGAPGAVNRDKVIEASQDHYVCDVSKALRDTGYRAAIPHAEGLAETAEWYRRQGWL